MSTTLERPGVRLGLDGLLSPGGSAELRWRVLALLNGYRVLVALVLLLLFYAVDSPRAVGSFNPTLFPIAVGAYVLIGLASAYTIARRWPAFELQIHGQVITDVFAVVTLMHASGGIDSGLGNLLVISVGAASLTLPGRAALSLAALAALAVLGEQLLAQLAGMSTGADYTPAGTLGAIIFLIALAAQPLARRIAESEALAEQRGVDLANLSELSEYIVQHLRESIVVIDAGDRVRLMNASAAKLLGADPAPIAGRMLRDLSPQLQESVTRWREGREAQSSFPSFAAADGATLVTPHFAPLGGTRPAAALIFLEDASQLAERVQQAKLAALGRLSASIAHEIRNPIGAISHAGQLLAESPSVPSEDRRLTDIIHTQSGRVSAIVDNVLQLSRRDNTRPQHISLTEWLTGFVAELEDHGHGDAAHAISLDSGGGLDLRVRVDPSHLHQILWNLCENALRHGRGADGAARLTLRTGRLPANGRPFLEVLDRGPGIPAELTDRIFEPFVTGASDGTGLGLFISRELSECNGATLRYARRDGGGSAFRMIFADPERWTV